ncbi:MAG: lytic transglycosylase domain-containing protein [Bdellovibrionales bacterium]|nr:lytic transglycosylase domain-containing protein [Bdellovibrionales bacterium]
MIKAVLEIGGHLILRHLVLCAALFILSGCVYQPLVDLNPGNWFATTSEVEVQPEVASPVKLATQDARARFFLPSREIVKLPAPKLEVNAEVQSQLNLYRKSKFVQKGLERAKPLRAYVRQILHDEGLPEELEALAFIESAYQPQVRSYAGAVGLWQLMASTARMYGLKVGWLKDQRKDPILSSIAAARHLRDLYFIFNDWHLALAAYNAGSASIRRAMHRSGAKDFWELSRSGGLKKQTRQFVPKFIAAALLLKEHTSESAVISSPS